MKNLAKLLLLMLVIVLSVSVLSSCKGDKDDNGGGKDEHTHAFDKRVENDKYVCRYETVVNRRAYYYSCKCGERGDETFEVGDTLPVHFGSYPQTLVKDETLSLGLTSLADGLPSVVGGSGNWTVYEYYAKGYPLGAMWYIDMEYKGDKYRGVYFESYRPSDVTSNSDLFNSNQNGNGYDIHKAYWFKYEPIAWHAVDSKDGQVLLLADLILDSQQYNYTLNDPNAAFLNSFVNSSLRSWLNDDFARTAISLAESNSLIKTQTKYELDFIGSADQEYITEDYIFAISAEELKDSKFFNESSDRVKQVTDYAKAQGAFSENGNGNWWLRTTGDLYGKSADAVGTDGTTSASGDVKNTSYGIVPALWLHVDEDGDIFGHNYATQKNDENNHWYECSCGKIEDVSSHIRDNWVETLKPNCTDTGIAKEICSECNFVLYTKTIPENGHKYNSKRICIVCSAENPNPSAGLKLDLVGNSYSVTGIGDCKDVIIVIPETYEDLPVTSIGDSAFSACSNVKSITIPDSITSIGNSSFVGCSALASITIPDGVRSIGSSAFRNCTALTNITIPEGVTSIDDSTFYGCTGLTSIAIGDAVTSIGNSAFYGCSSLTKINIPDSLKNIGNDAFYGCNKIIQKIGNVSYVGQWLIDCESSVTIAEIKQGTIGIAFGAFSNCNRLNSITLPFVGAKKDSVENTHFGYIFGASSYLDNINYVPASLKSVTITGGSSIAESAFSGCSSLESITLPFVGDSIKTSSDKYQYPFGYIFGTSKYTGGVATEQYYYDSSTSYITSTTYYIPSSLKSVTITGGNILYGAFYNCSSLTSITIPDGVTSIGDYAFYNCKSLTSIIIPDGVTSIGNYAFEDCKSLTSITIPDSVTSIGNYAFEVCSSLTSITIPDSVTSIGSHAFSYCSSLTSITIPDSVTTIYDWAFRYCSSLTSITIPNSVTSIGSYAFRNCSSLTSITIPNSVTSIGSSAFKDCSNLTSITIPDSVTSISLSMFDGCTKLIQVENGVSYIDKWVIGCDTMVTSVSLRDDTVGITDDVFYGCKSLTSITIPNSVTSIGSGAFSGCSSLESITLPFVGGSKKTSSSTYQYPFGYIFGTSSYTGGVATKQYYYGSYTDYTTSTTYYIPESLKSVTITGGNILYGAFYNCSNLTNITIGDGVTSIGDSAFNGCSNIVYNEFDNAYYLGNDNNPYVVLVKTKDTSITHCTIHDDTRFIYSSAFGGCSRLTGITIPDSVTSIGNSAFRNCSSLTSIIIPGNVIYIGDYAFVKCSRLVSIEFVDTKSWYERYHGDCPATYEINVTDMYINASIFTSEYNHMCYWYKE